MKLPRWHLGLAAAALGICLGSPVLAQKPTGPVPDYSDKWETARLERLAKETLHLNLGKEVQSGAAANFVGVRSERILLSQRLDSRTYFVQDSEFGKGKRAGVFSGPNEELLLMARDFLRRLEIPVAEVEKAAVLQEKSQVAHLDRETNKLTIEKEEEGKRFVRFSRKVEGLPIFSSHALVGVTQDKQVGFLEVHWPRIPQETLQEAHRLAYRVQHGWRPPEQKGARVESIEAGVVHSPAVGFVMDIYPAIRVIYAPEEKQIGQKPVLYFDRDGKTVPVPREYYQPAEERKDERPRPAEKK